MLDLRPLRSSDFRHLTTAYAVNEGGSLVGEIALTILVYAQTHSPLGSAALFTGLRTIPALGAPLVATRIETLRPKFALTLLYLLEAAIFVGIALISRHFSLAAVLALTALDACLAVTAKALTRSATATALVREGLLREGNGILNLALMAAAMIAPAVAGVLVSWQGVEWAILVDAGSFVLAAAAVLSAREIRIESDELIGWLGRLQKGMDVLRYRRAVRHLIVAITVIILFSAIPTPIEIVFVKRTLHGNDADYGLLLAAWGAGMAVGAVVFALMNDVRLMVAVGVGTLLILIGLGGLAVSPTLAVACVAAAIAGVGNGGAWIGAITSVQERIPLDTQSAMMSLLEALNQVAPAIGFAIGGFLTVATSPRVAYGAAAVGMAIVVAVVAVRPIDRVELSSEAAMLYPGAGDSRTQRHPAGASTMTRSIDTRVPR